MSERILVPFEGPGAGVGELTWGQQQIWAAMRATDTSQSLCAVMSLPVGKTAVELAAELRFFLCRYASLRSRLRFDAEGRATQEVAGSGEAELTIFAVDDDVDPAVAAQDLADRWEAAAFDYGREWPMRLAAVRHRGVDTHVVVVLSHLAADAGGVAVMMGELAGWDPATEPLLTPPAGPGPLELARRQAEPADQRHSLKALAHWERVLRAAPPIRFAPPTVRDEPRYQQVDFVSPAMLLAVRAVAARTGGATSPVLLAAYAVALARITGVHPVVTQVIVSNRFRPGLSDAVHPVSQNGLILLDVADVTIDEAVERAVRASILASKHAYYDPIECDRLRERVERERGAEIEIGCVFNDRRLAPVPDLPVPTPELVRDALPLRTMQWGKPLPLFNERLMVTVEESPDAVVLLVEMDTHALAASEVEALLLTMESVVVEAAFDPAVVSRVS